MLLSLKRKIQNSVVYAYGFINRGHSFISPVYRFSISFRCCLHDCYSIARDLLVVVYMIVRLQLDNVCIIVMGHYNLIMLIYFMREGVKCYSRRGA